MKRIEIDKDKVYNFNYHNGSMGMTKKGVIHRFVLPITNKLNSVGEFVGYCEDINGNNPINASKAIGYDEYKRISELQSKCNYVILSKNLGKGTISSNYAYEKPTENKGMTWSEYVSYITSYQPEFSNSILNVFGIEYDIDNWD